MTSGKFIHEHLSLQDSGKLDFQMKSITTFFKASLRDGMVSWGRMIRMVLRGDVPNLTMFTSWSDGGERMQLEGGRKVRGRWERERELQGRVITALSLVTDGPSLSPIKTDRRTGICKVLFQAPGDKKIFSDPLKEQILTHTLFQRLFRAEFKRVIVSDHRLWTQGKRPAGRLKTVLEIESIVDGWIIRSKKWRAGLPGSAHQIWSWLGTGGRRDAGGVTDEAKSGYIPWHDV